MVLPIFPTSPVYADMTRNPFWNAGVQKFDSGARQGSTPYTKPLYQYSINITNMQRTKQQSLHAFWNARKGSVSPFLFEDPYDNYINGVPCVRSGTGARSFFVVTSDGYGYIPVSGSLLITSALSGALVQGTHYQFNPDTGVFSTFAVATGDTWTASCRYFRKVAFDAYQEHSNIWQNFNGSVSFSEIALP